MLCSLIQRADLGCLHGFVNSHFCEGFTVKQTQNCVCPWTLLRFGLEPYAERSSGLLLISERSLIRLMLRYNYEQFLAALGERVKQIRKDRGLTHRALVTDHGFHLTGVQRIERGEGISVPTLLRLCEVYQVRIDELVAGIGMVTEGEGPTKPSKE